MSIKGLSRIDVDLEDSVFPLQGILWVGENRVFIRTEDVDEYILDITTKKLLLVYKNRQKPLAKGEKIEYTHIIPSDQVREAINSLNDHFIQDIPTDIDIVRENPSMTISSCLIDKAVKSHLFPHALRTSWMLSWGDSCDTGKLAETPIPYIWQIIFKQEEIGKFISDYQPIVIHVDDNKILIFITRWDRKYEIYSYTK